LSVILAGILIATLAKLPTAVGGLLVAAFMVFHGFAHGAEMPVGSHFSSYMLGFVTTPIMIAFVGRGVGTLLVESDRWITRAIGTALVCVGLMFAA
jgi:urease accessory protein